MPLLVLVLLSPATATPPDADAPAPCHGAPPCEQPRTAWVDFATFGVVPWLRGGVEVVYDYAEVVRQLDLAELESESEVSLAVRLIVSEVGADRLVASTLGWQEAIGILYTVDNRLQRDRWNPLGVLDAEPWPGCGDGGTFGTCANPVEYLGMKSWRALDPRRRYDEPLLERAVDLAVAAWWLQDNGFVDDLTHGATSYVHRCGGTAYGMTTHHCDGHLGTPERDVPGANPHSGPLVFKAPGRFDEIARKYRLAVSAIVDFATAP